MAADTEIMVLKRPTENFPFDTIKVPQKNIKIIRMNNDDLLFQDLAKLQLDPLLCRLVILSTKLGCSTEIVIIVAMETIFTKLYLNTTRHYKLGLILTKFLVVESDYLTLLRMFQASESQGFSANWCATHGVNRSDMTKVQEFQRQLALILRQHQIPLVSCGIRWLVLLKCISVTYFHQSARLVDAVEGRYDHCKSGAALYIYPSSAVMNFGCYPNVIVYHKQILTSERTYMRGVTIIDADWVPSLGTPLLHALKSAEGQKREKLVKVPIKVIRDSDSQIQVRFVIRRLK